jgi:DNA-binding response OmpR family regulator
VVGGGDGDTEQARMTNANRPNLPIIFVTGADAATSLPGHPVVQKPFSPSELLVQVAVALDVHARA